MYDHYPPLVTAPQGQGAPTLTLLGPSERRGSLSAPLAPPMPQMSYYPSQPASYLAYSTDAAVPNPLAYFCDPIPGWAPHAPTCTNPFAMTFNASMEADPLFGPGPDLWLFASGAAGPRASGPSPDAAAAAAAARAAPPPGRLWPDPHAPAGPAHARAAPFASPAAARYRPTPGAASPRPFSTAPQKAAGEDPYGAISRFHPVIDPGSSGYMAHAHPAAVRAPSPVASSLAGALTDRRAPSAATLPAPITIPRPIDIQRGSSPPAGTHAASLRHDAPPRPSSSTLAHALDDRPRRRTTHAAASPTSSASTSMLPPRILYPPMQAFSFSQEDAAPIAPVQPPAAPLVAALAAASAQRSSMTAAATQPPTHSPEQPSTPPTPPPPSSPSDAASSSASITPTATRPSSAPPKTKRRSKQKGKGKAAPRPVIETVVEFPALRQQAQGGRRRGRAHKAPPRRVYQCEMCSKAFDRPSTLEKHYRTHTGEKPFLCIHCGCKFSIDSNRNRHEKTCATKHPTPTGFRADNDGDAGETSETGRSEPDAPSFSSAASTSSSAAAAAAAAAPVASTSQQQLPPPGPPPRKRNRGTRLSGAPLGPPPTVAGVRTVPTPVQLLSRMTGVALVNMDSDDSDDGTPDSVALGAIALPTVPPLPRLELDDLAAGPSVFPSTYASTSAGSGSESGQSSAPSTPALATPPPAPHVSLAGMKRRPAPVDAGAAADDAGAWVPDSLRGFQLGIWCPKAPVPLPPVHPFHTRLENVVGVGPVPVGPAGAHVLHQQGWIVEEEWAIEERDSWAPNISERPYHPDGWNGRLPGPRPPRPSERFLVRADELSSAEPLPTLRPTKRLPRS